jgi:exopolyphosphatase/guanosine-5'-triphosphate,3'-diphosphate pyrophosphatase
MDLGTNTFHLLIAEGCETVFFKPIVHIHEGIKLGEGGINSGLIAPAPFKRGISAMQKFAALIQENNVDAIKAIATSALRNASNGHDFIEQVRNTTGIEIEIIDGNREAEFIYKGIKAAHCMDDTNSLIMDIGGGSVEFILGNSNTIIWKQSFEIGAARLMEMFHHTDPIPAASIEALNVHLDNSLGDLFEALEGTAITKLIGSSGVFETFAEVIELNKGNSFDLKKTTNYLFDHDELVNITDKFIRSSHHERRATKGIIPVRIDMIVVASLITRYIMQKFDINVVQMCTYSLKEGVLAEMLS